MNFIGDDITKVCFGLLAGYLAQFLQPRSKLLFWSPHNFFFNLKAEKVSLQTNSLTIQNVGRLPAEDVEIIYKQKPDFFELFPAVEYQEITTSNGQHVIKVKNLGPKEWLVVQLLSYKTTPMLENVRWKNGQAKWVQIQPQRVWPRWVNVLVNVLLLIGTFSVAYWLFQAATRLGYL